jgi:hypothetical protein
MHVRLRLTFLAALAAASAVTTGAFGNAGGGNRALASPLADIATLGDCSRAAARDLVERLHLGNAGDPNLSDPVGQVLCGAFVGPGSQAMVVSLAIPSCGRTAGWVVFRWTGDAWQLVLTRNNGADLAAVGSDIKETQNVLRPSDAHCFPTGGTRSRVWHWNGTRFTSTSWKYSKPLKPKSRIVQLYYIRSPSHNLWCDVGDEGQAFCVSRSRPHTATLTLGGRVKICSGAGCFRNPNVFKSGTPVLAYGEVDEQAGFRCRSETKGITCTVRAGKARGKGFLINAAGVTRVGP